jgi:hypothetical protein
MPEADAAPLAAAQRDTLDACAALTALWVPEGRYDRSRVVERLSALASKVKITTTLATVEVSKLPDADLPSMRPVSSFRPQSKALRGREDPTVVMEAVAMRVPWRAVIDAVAAFLLSRESPVRVACLKVLRGVVMGRECVRYVGDSLVCGMIVRSLERSSRHVSERSSAFRLVRTMLETLPDEFPRAILTSCLVIAQTNAETSRIQAASLLLQAACTPASLPRVAQAGGIDALCKALHSSELQPLHRTIVLSLAWLADQPHARPYVTHRMWVDAITTPLVRSMASPKDVAPTDGERRAWAQSRANILTASATWNGLVPLLAHPSGVAHIVAVLARNRSGVQCRLAVMRLVAELLLPRNRFCDAAPLDQLRTAAESRALLLRRLALDPDVEAAVGLRAVSARVAGEAFERRRATPAWQFLRRALGSAATRSLSGDPMALSDDDETWEDGAEFHASYWSGLRHQRGLADHVKDAVSLATARLAADERYRHTMSDTSSLPSAASPAPPPTGATPASLADVPRALVARALLEADLPRVLCLLAVDQHPLLAFAAGSVLALLLRVSHRLLPESLLARVVVLPELASLASVSATGRFPARLRATFVSRGSFRASLVSLPGRQRVVGMLEGALTSDTASLMKRRSESVRRFARAQWDMLRRHLWSDAVSLPSLADVSGGATPGAARPASLERARAHERDADSLARWRAAVSLLWAGGVSAATTSLPDDRAMLGDARHVSCVLALLPAGATPAVQEAVEVSGAASLASLADQAFRGRPAPRDVTLRLAGQRRETRIAPVASYAWAGCTDILPRPGTPAPPGTAILWLSALALHSAEEGLLWDVRLSDAVSLPSEALAVMTLEPASPPAVSSSWSADAGWGWWRSDTGLPPSETRMGVHPLAVLSSSEPLDNVSRIASLRPFDDSGAVEWTSNALPPHGDWGDPIPLDVDVMRTDAEKMASLTGVTSLAGGFVTGLPGPRPPVDWSGAPGPLSERRASLVAHQTPRGAVREALLARMGGATRVAQPPPDPAVAALRERRAERATRETSTADLDALHAGAGMTVRPEDVPLTSTRLASLLHSLDGLVASLSSEASLVHLIAPEDAASLAARLQSVTGVEVAEHVEQDDERSTTTGAAGSDPPTVHTASVVSDLDDDAGVLTMVVLAALASEEATEVAHSVVQSLEVASSDDASMRDASSFVARLMSLSARLRGMAGWASATFAMTSSVASRSPALPTSAHGLPAAAAMLAGMSVSGASVSDAVGDSVARGHGWGSDLAGSELGETLRDDPSGVTGGLWDQVSDDAVETSDAPLSSDDDGGADDDDDDDTLDCTDSDTHSDDPGDENDEDSQFTDASAIDPLPLSPPGEPPGEPRGMLSVGHRAGRWFASLTRARSEEEGGSSSRGVFEVSNGSSLDWLTLSDAESLAAACSVRAFRSVAAIAEESLSRRERERVSRLVGHITSRARVSPSAWKALGRAARREWRSNASHGVVGASDGGYGDGPFRRFAAAVIVTCRPTHTVGRAKPPPEARGLASLAGSAGWGWAFAAKGALDAAPLGIDTASLTASLNEALLPRAPSGDAFLPLATRTYTPLYMTITPGPVGSDGSPLPRPPLFAFRPGDAASLSTVALAPRRARYVGRPSWEGDTASLATYVPHAVDAWPSNRGGFGPSLAEPFQRARRNHEQLESRGILLGHGATLSEQLRATPQFTAARNACSAVRRLSDAVSLQSRSFVPRASATERVNETASLDVGRPQPPMSVIAATVLSDGERRTVAPPPPKASGLTTAVPRDPPRPSSRAVAHDDGPAGAALPHELLVPGRRPDESELASLAYATNAAEPMARRVPSILAGDRFNVWNLAVAESDALSLTGVQEGALLLFDGGTVRRVRDALASDAPVSVRMAVVGTVGVSDTDALSAASLMSIVHTRRGPSRTTAAVSQWMSDAPSLWKRPPLPPASSASPARRRSSARRLPRRPTAERRLAGDAIAQSLPVGPMAASVESDSASLAASDTMAPPSATPPRPSRGGSVSKVLARLGSTRGDAITAASLSTGASPEVSDALIRGAPTGRMGRRVSRRGARKARFRAAAGLVMHALDGALLERDAASLGSDVRVTWLPPVEQRVLVGRRLLRDAAALSAVSHLTAPVLGEADSLRVEVHAPEPHERRKPLGELQRRGRERASDSASLVERWLCLGAVTEEERLGRRATERRSGEPLDGEWGELASLIPAGVPMASPPMSVGATRVSQWWRSPRETFVVPPTFLDAAATSARAFPASLSVALQLGGVPSVLGDSSSLVASLSKVSLPSSPAVRLPPQCVEALAASMGYLNDLHSWDAVLGSRPSGRWGGLGASGATLGGRALSGPRDTASLVSHLRRAAVASVRSAEAALPVARAFAGATLSDVDDDDADVTERERRGRTLHGSLEQRASLLTMGDARSFGSSGVSGTFLADSNDGSDPALPSSLPRPSYQAPGSSSTNTTVPPSPTPEEMALLKRALLLVSESGVERHRDWRMWDWAVVAEVLDGHCSVGHVVESLLSRTRFFHRLAFALYPATDEYGLGSQAAVSDAQGRLQRSDDGEHCDAASLKAPKCYVPASLTVERGDPSSSGRTITPQPGRPLASAGATSVSRLPWCAASLRFARVLRSFFLCLAHSPSGRAALVVSDAKSLRKGSLPEALPGDVLRATLLSVLTAAGCRSCRPNVSPTVAAPVSTGFFGMGKSDAASLHPSGSLVSEWRLSHELSREYVAAVSALLSTPTGRDVVSRVAANNFGRGFAVDPPPGPALPADAPTGVAWAGGSAAVSVWRARERRIVALRNAVIRDANADRRGKATVVSPTLVASLEGEPMSDTPFLDPTNIVGAWTALGTTPPVALASLIASASLGESATDSTRRSRVALTAERGRSLAAEKASLHASMGPAERLADELTEEWGPGRHPSLARAIATAIDPGRVPMMRALLRHWTRHGDCRMWVHCLGCYRNWLRRRSEGWRSWGVCALAELLEEPALSRAPLERAATALSVLTEASLASDAYRRAIVARRPNIPPDLLAAARPLLTSAASGWAGRGTDAGEGAAWLAELGVLGEMLEEWGSVGVLAELARVDASLADLSAAESLLPWAAHSPLAWEGDAAKSDAASLLDGEPTSIPVWLPAPALGDEAPSPFGETWSLSALLSLPWRIEVWAEWWAFDGGFGTAGQPKLRFQQQRLSVDTLVDASAYRPEASDAAKGYGVSQSAFRNRSWAAPVAPSAPERVGGFTGVRLLGMCVDDEGRPEAVWVPRNARLRVALFLGPHPVDPVTGDVAFGAVNVDQARANVARSVGVHSAVLRACGAAAKDFADAADGLATMAVSSSATMAVAAGVRPRSEPFANGRATPCRMRQDSAAASVRLADSLPVRVKSCLEWSKDAGLVNVDPAQSVGVLVSRALRDGIDPARVRFVATDPGGVMVEAAAAATEMAVSSVERKRTVSSRGEEEDEGGSDDADGGRDPTADPVVSDAASPPSASTTAIPPGALLAVEEPVTSMRLPGEATRHAIAQSDADVRWAVLPLLEIVGDGDAKSTYTRVSWPHTHVRVKVSTSALSPGATLVERVEVNLSPVPERRHQRPLPASLPASLARTTLGRRALLRSGLLHQAAVALSDVESLPVPVARSALWLIATVGQVPGGFELLRRHVCADILHRVERVAHGSAGPGSAAASLSVRGTALVAVSLLAQCPEARMDLHSLGWALPAAFGSGTGGVALSEAVGSGRGVAHEMSGALVDGDVVPRSVLTGHEAGTGHASLMASAEALGAGPASLPPPSSLASLTCAPLRPVLPTDIRGLLTLCETDVTADGISTNTLVDLPAHAASLRHASLRPGPMAAASLMTSGALAETSGGFTHGPSVPRAQSDAEASLIEAVQQLALRFTQKEGETTINLLLKDHASLFKSPSTYQLVHQTLATLRLSLQARRFVMNLFDDLTL